MVLFIICNLMTIERQFYVLNISIQINHIFFEVRKLNATGFSVSRILFCRNMDLSKDIRSVPGAQAITWLPIPTNQGQYVLVFDSEIHIWVMGGLFIVFLSPCQSTVENGAHKKPKEAQAENSSIVNIVENQRSC